MLPGLVEAAAVKQDAARNQLNDMVAVIHLSGLAGVFKSPGSAAMVCSCRSLSNLYSNAADHD
jgi:hypothetical protein